MRWGSQHTLCDGKSVRTKFAEIGLAWTPLCLRGRSGSWLPTGLFDAIYEAGRNSICAQLGRIGEDRGRRAVAKAWPLACAASYFLPAPRISGRGSFRRGARSRGQLRNRAQRAARELAAMRTRSLPALSRKPNRWIDREWLCMGRVRLTFAHVELSRHRNPTIPPHIANRANVAAHARRYRRREAQEIHLPIGGAERHHPLRVCT